MNDNTEKGKGGRITGVLFILTAGICWGTMGLFVRNLDSYGLDPMEIIMIRVVVTVALMFLFLLFYDRSMLRIRLRDIWCFIGTGVLSMVFFNYCYFRMIMISSMSVASVMLYTAPVFVMLMSAVLFGERITPMKLIALAATVAGCAFVTGFIGDSVHLTPAAVLLGLGAGSGYALYSIFTRFALNRGYHSFTISLYTFLIAGAALLPIVDIRHLAVCLTAGPDRMLLAASCGLVTTVLPYIVYNFGLLGVETGKAAIIASVEPVVATLLGVIVYKENMSTGNLIGVILVLGAIVLCNISTGKNTRE